MSSVRFRFRVRAKSPSARFMHFGSGTRRAGQQTALNGRVADWLLGWLVSCPSDRWIVGVRPSGPPPCSMLPDPQSPLESSDPLSLFIHSVERRRSLYLNNVWPKFEFCARCLCVVLFFPPDKKVLVTNKSLAEKSTMSFISLVFFLDFLHSSGFYHSAVTDNRQFFGLRVKCFVQLAKTRKLRYQNMTQEINGRIWLTRKTQTAGVKRRNIRETHLADSDTTLNNKHRPWASSQQFINRKQAISH